MPTVSSPRALTLAGSTLRAAPRPWSRPRAAATLLGTCALIAACSKPAQDPPGPPTVLVAVVRPDTEGDAVRYAAEVRPRYESVLSFRIDGLLVERSARLGDAVHAGQELARLDPGDPAATESASQAGLEGAQSRLDLARRLHERNLAQVKDELVSQADLDQSEAGLKAAQAEVDQRRQELELARHQARYTRLIADQDGYISSESADAGTVLKAGQAVVGLAWSRERDVVIDVPESRIGTVRRGQVAVVDFPALGGPSTGARVREIAAVADPVARTYRVRLALDHPQAARLGSSAEVSLVAPAAGAPRLLVPATALFHDGTEPAVWVLAAPDHRLSLRRVTVAQYHADTVAVSGGLAAGETVVAQGVHAVNAGEVVAPSTADAADAMGSRSAR